MSYPTPRIFVSCLASYNDGTHHGEWIDATDVDIMGEEIAGMLVNSPAFNAEEYAIHDTDNFGCLDIGEYDTIAKVASLIEEYGDAFAAYADNVGIEHAEEDEFQESYSGEWDSEKAFAENLWDDLYANDVPDHIKNYIDIEAFARDLFCGDYYTLDNPSGGYFIFHN